MSNEQKIKDIVNVGREARLAARALTGMLPNNADCPDCCFPITVENGRHKDALNALTISGCSKVCSDVGVIFVTHDGLDILERSGIPYDYVKVQEPELDHYSKLLHTDSVGEEVQGVTPFLLDEQ
jgi:hypothetical protein